MAQEKLTITLNTGAEMPIIGLGTWKAEVGGVVGKTVEAALRAGYKLIDTAHIYCNEGEVGEALLKCFREGVCKREDVFITSKLWNGDHAPEDVLPACRLTLERLQLEYLNLYLMHWPVPLRKGVPLADLTPEDRFGYSPEAVGETWKAMEECVSKGLVKAIGISNFTITKIEALLKTARIVPAVNQVECHPYLQQQKLKEYCTSKGMVFEAYAPLGSPTRTVKWKYDSIVMEDPVLKEIATKHSVTVGQVCIAFALHREMVVIPKTAKVARLVENLESIEVKLNAEDLRQLRELDRNKRFFRGRRFYLVGETQEQFWDADGDKAFEVKLPPPQEKMNGESLHNS